MRYAIVLTSLAAAAAAQSGVAGTGTGSSVPYVRLELRMIPLETVVLLCLLFPQLQ